MFLTLNTVLLTISYICFSWMKKVVVHCKIWIHIFFDSFWFMLLRIFDFGLSRLIYNLWNCDLDFFYYYFAFWKLPMAIFSHTLVNKQLCHIHENSGLFLIFYRINNELLDKSYSKKIFFYNLDQCLNLILKKKTLTWIIISNIKSNFLKLNSLTRNFFLTKCQEGCCRFKNN